MAQITPSNLVPFTGTIQAGQRLLKHSDGTFIPVGATITTGPSTSDGNITPDTVLSGCIGYNSSGRVEGAIPSIPSSTYTVDSNGYTLSAGQYIAGNQTFIGTGGGIVTSDGNITSDTVLSGYIGYNSSGAVTGSIPILAGSTTTVDSNGITIPAGYYLGGSQTFIGSGGGGGGVAPFQLSGNTSNYQIGSLTMYSGCTATITSQTFLRSFDVSDHAVMIVSGGTLGQGIQQISQGGTLIMYGGTVGGTYGTDIYGGTVHVSGGSFKYFLNEGGTVVAYSGGTVYYNEETTPPVDSGGTIIPLQQ